MKGIILVGCLSIFGCYAQEVSDSVNFSESQINNDTLRSHSVRTAVILSAALPGAGQVYNHLAMPKGKKKAFWKVPLIYAGLGASTYFLIDNQLTSRALRKEYNQRLEGLEGDPQWQGYDLEGVLALHDQHLNRRDLSILALGVVYILQLVDAGVEAHFVSFDVSEDLSLAFEPTMMDRSTLGMTLRLNFR